jgi:hypothetical protein
MINLSIGLHQSTLSHHRLPSYEKLIRGIDEARIFQTTHRALKHDSRSISGNKKADNVYDKLIS